MPKQSSPSVQDMHSPFSFKRASLAQPQEERFLAPWNGAHSDKPELPTTICIVDQRVPVPQSMHMVNPGASAYLPTLQRSQDGCPDEEANLPMPHGLQVSAPLSSSVLEPAEQLKQLTASGSDVVP